MGDQEATTKTVTVEQALRDPELAKRKFRMTLSFPEWFVLQRTVCRALYADEELRKRGRGGLWDYPGEREVAGRLWDKLCLLHRRSTAGTAAYLAKHGIKYDYRAPDYRNPRWHRRRKNKKP